MYHNLQCGKILMAAFHLSVSNKQEMLGHCVCKKEIERLGDNESVNKSAI